MTAREGQTFHGVSRVVRYVNFVKLPHTLFALPFALVGGIFNPYGPLLGTVLLWVVPQYVPVLGDWRFVAYGAVVIAMTLFRPVGLLGDRRPKLRAAHREPETHSDEATT